ncbi:hypothetical protein ZWY2020_024983 [Hordeum vulgare]|nr:hypothetical protein ZWY2020_024983 [Hordeum vulgare]
MHAAKTSIQNSVVYKVSWRCRGCVARTGDTDQPLRRSSSTSYHGDGFIDAPYFVNATQPEKLLTQGKAPPPMSAIGVDDWDATTLEETCVAVDMVDASKGKTYPLDGSVSPELHTPVAAVGADGLGSSNQDHAFHDE